MKGTVCKVFDFFNAEEYSLKVEVGGVASDFLKFSKDRRLAIPLYQREIRWEDSNVNVLLNDIMSGPKFLGNIFLAENDIAFGYDIIDGQQRLSTIYFLLSVLKNNYSDDYTKLNRIALLPFINESFPSFDDYSVISMLESCDVNDPFEQKDRYIKIHNIISDFLRTQTVESRVHFSRNVLACELNVIVYTRSESDLSIDAFVDINVKGVKLDSEDILKGYFFKRSEDSKDLWKKMKIEYFKLAKHDKKVKLIDILYNVIFSILKNEKDNKYEKLTMNKELELVDDFELIENGNKKIYNKGTHVMELLYPSSFVNNVINYAIDFIKLNCDFYNNVITSNANIFIDSFGLAGMDSEVRPLYFTMISSMLRNKVALYKFFSVYCFIIAKNDRCDIKYKRSVIESCYFYTFIWDFLSKRKGVYTVTNEIGSVDMLVTKLYEFSKNLLEGSLEPRINFTKKMVNDDEDLSDTANNLKYTVLHMATIYECFQLDNNNKKIDFNKDNFIKIYNLTIEHFMINASGKYTVDGGEGSEKYTDDQKSKTNLMINLMPLSKNINSILENKCLKDKIELIDQEVENDGEFWEKYGSIYSKQYYGIVKNNFTINQCNLDQIQVEIVLGELFEKIRNSIINSR